MPEWEAKFWVKAQGPVTLIIETETEEEAIQKAEEIEKTYWEQWEAIEESFDTSWVTDFELEGIIPYE